MYMGTLGTEFSADYVSVLLMINAITTVLVLAGLYLDKFAGAFARALEKAQSYLVYPKAHFSPPQK